MAAGEASLSVLLATMSPVLRSGEYAFCTVPPGGSIPSDSFATVVEDEGTTAIVPLSSAVAAGLQPVFLAGCITLTVHSDLAAVGFLAAIAAELAAAGISCNTISGVHHDHLFVPYERSEEALELLSRLSSRSIQ